jgi:hypothetical protein
MNHAVIKGIADKLGIPGIVGLLSEKLSGSELNSLLMEVFSRKVSNISPGLLLKQYQANRFVHPAQVDMVELLHLELRVLQFLKERQFDPLELSPVAQLGSCSVVATVDQNKIISAARNTEVLADATNSIALFIADGKKTGRLPAPDSQEQLRYCTVHRHVRTPPLIHKHHTAHFKIACLVSSGVDTGNYYFESTGLREHILALHDLLENVFGIRGASCALIPREGYDSPNPLIDRVISHLHETTPEIKVAKQTATSANNYYKGIQFKMNIEIEGQTLEIADGGFVDWSQQLLNNSKERMLISGFGLEWMYKIQSLKTPV